MQQRHSTRHEEKEHRQIRNEEKRIHGKKKRESYQTLSKNIKNELKPRTTTRRDKERNILSKLHEMLRRRTEHFM